MKTLRYFYHSDHLGSTSWVTDSAKNGVQYCEYLPYGEPFIDQRSTTWSSRYTFSGKERDSETGYSYFGARYYDSGLSIWLSVDPMSDKYPNLTPYAYCANNPVILVDPDGRKDRPFNAKTDKPITPQKGTATPIQYTYNDKGKLIYSSNSSKNAYNCHSYAWHNSQGDPNPAQDNIPTLNGTSLPKWDNNPSDDIKQQNVRQLGSDENNLPGDIVIYYTDADGNGWYDDGEYISHSAVVKTVDEEGYTTTVIGKMGRAEISENHPNAPNYYNKDIEGNNTSRAYFRINKTLNDE